MHMSKTIRFDIKQSHCVGFEGTQFGKQEELMLYPIHLARNIKDLEVPTCICMCLYKQLTW